MVRINVADTGSEFRAKGVVYRGAVEYYAGHVPGGVEAVSRAIADPDHRRFFDQLFVSGGWYDALPIAPISRAAAVASGITHRELVTQNARWLAHRDLKGIYRFILAVTSPRRVALSLPKLSLRYFDFGSAYGKLSGETTLLAEQTGVPAPLSSWMVWAVEGFAPVAMKLAGARSAKVSMGDDPVVDGVEGRIETVKLTWKIEWEP